MSPWEQALWWVLMLVGLIGTAVYSGLETGLYFLDRVKLEVRAAHGPYRWAARVLKRENKRPQRLLASNLIATIFFGDLGATGASQIMAGRGYSEGAIIAVNAAVLTPVFFVFVETVPKELFRLTTDRLTYALAWLVAGTRMLLTAVGALPLVRVVTGSVGKMVGGEGEAGLEMSARERIATMLKDSTTAGALSESQAGLVDQALMFHQTTVADEMVPWARVRVIPADWTREQVVRLLSRERFSHWPVVERRAGDAVRVVGVLRHQDVFIRPGMAPAELAAAPGRVSPRMHLHEAVLKVREAAVPVGIVEENGRPIGMVTMSDLIEPMTGVMG